MIMVISSSGANIYQKEGIFYKRTTQRESHKNDPRSIFHAINPYDRLKKQYDWLIKICAIESVREHFPTLQFFHQDEQLIEYGIDFIKGSPINNLPSDKLILEHLKCASIFIRDKLHTMEISRINNPHYFLENHIKKLMNRLKIFNRIKPGHDMLFNTEYLFVNGKKLKNLPLIIQELTSDSKLLKALTPEYTCVVHGDLHLGNIYIPENSKHFYLIDPRGTNSDPMYDISKLSHNTLGMYDFAYLRKFDLTFDKETTHFTLNFTLSPEEIMHYNVIAGYLKDVYTHVWIETYTNKSNFIAQYLANNASHCIGAVPFQLFNSPHKKTDYDFMPLYIIGIYLFNKLLDIKNSGLTCLHDIDFSDSPVELFT
jgi:hypothetical protein